jgi:hypothetical protein
MSRENLLWGAPRIHGELLMLGIEVAESTVGRYVVRRRRPRRLGQSEPAERPSADARRKAELGAGQMAEKTIKRRLQDAGDPRLPPMTA